MKLIMGNDVNQGLIDFLMKIQNIADFLARGYFLENPDEGYAIEIVSNSAVIERQAFSVCEYSIYDELETYYYGEQKSIEVLIEFIEDGEYERQIEGRIDFDIPYTPKPEDAKFYNMVMNRIKRILRLMAVTLISGGRIPVDKIDFIGLKMAYLDEESRAFYEEDDDEKGFLLYDLKTGLFYATNPEGEVVIEDIDISVGLEFYNQFLREREEEVLYNMAIEASREGGEGEEEKQQTFSEGERE